MARKKSFEQRLGAAGTRAKSALGLFEQAAVSLEAAASEAERVSDEAAAEALRLITLGNQADAQVVANRAQAAKIREFIGE